ncbi:hypothetical protein VNO80_14410 [Phaseolus coccineus]|uniref:Uncharacterized protein n=1 Tax=Phaseolus coccineus TaxID=3886 RepID=A0AAN9MNC2_PHACN
MARHAKGTQAKTHSSTNRPFKNKPTGDASTPWANILSTIEHTMQTQIEANTKKVKKSNEELDKPNFVSPSLRRKSLKWPKAETSLRKKLANMAQDRDDALGKLQRTMEDYARHREEHQAANRARESTKSMLHNKISTLDTALVTAKDKI